MTALWTASEAAAATGGRARGDWAAHGVSIDTRTIQPGDLFVALKDVRDGHDFVAQALEMLPDGPYDGDSWGNWTAAVKEATGRKGKGLFMPLRKAVTGLERGPEMADVMQLLQKKPSL